MSIVFENVSHIYGLKGINEHTALREVSLEIKEGSFVGLVGHTGSGKSTLVQLASGLLTPSHGRIYIDGSLTTDASQDARKKKRDVGLVFQYPEHQLFEETVAKDVAFGPKNQGLDEPEIEKRVRDALALVGLEYDLWHDKSPFDLSGGQKRRVALAGVLAMHPKYLILDEPTAGLDPLGRDRVLENVAMLHREVGMGIILVSHSMDDVAQYADRIIVMNGGRLTYDGAPEEVFKHVQELEAIGLGVPHVTELLHRLKKAGLDVDTSAVTVSGAKATILEALAEREEASHAR